MTRAGFSFALIAATWRCGSPTAQPDDTGAVTTQYLAFQVMVGTASTASPPPRLIEGTQATEPLIRTPQDSITALVDSIVTSIGSTGSRTTKLAYIIGPLSFDHSDAEITSMIGDAFALARRADIAVGFHIDDAMFWTRSALFSDANKERATGFDGELSTGLFLDWGSPAAFPPRICMSCDAVRSEVSRRARDVFGATIVQELAVLNAEGRDELFAGVIAGWESHMGQDFALATADDGRDPRLGFKSLALAGLGPSNPPASFGEAVERVVKDHIERWAEGLAVAGVPRSKIYSHVNFMPRSVFTEAQRNGQIPSALAYADVVNTQPSSVASAIAFSELYNPGFSMYPTPGTLDEIYEQLAVHDNPPWAQCEGANVSPGLAGATTGTSSQSMEAYLSQRFDHGATLVNIFGMGIGGMANPFRIAAEGPEALDAYRRFLER